MDRMRGLALSWTSGVRRLELLKSRLLREVRSLGNAWNGKRFWEELCGRLRCVALDGDYIVVAAIVRVEDAESQVT